MASQFVPFVSERVKDAKREQTRAAREIVLNQAKKDYEKAERRKEQAKQRGEDKWMLPAIQNRIDKEEKEMEKIKSKKKKKEKKKLKKEKKKRKKKEKDSDSDSSSESDDDASLWVEKSSVNTIPKSGSEAPIAKGPKLQRDSWMEAPMDLIPTTSRQEIRERIRQDKEEKERQQNLLDQPGQHAQELNPYWKDGGTGLPEEKRENKTVSAAIGDGGLSWMRKAYDRCVQQAKEEGKTLEEVAAEKYGSLKKLNSMLADAEKANKELRRQPMNKTGKPSATKGFKKPGDSDDDEVCKHSRHRSRSHSRDRYRSIRSRSHSKDRYRSRRSRSHSRDRYRSIRSRSHSKDRYRSRRSRSHSRDRNRSRRSRSHSRDRYRSRSRSRSRDRYRSRRSKSRTRSRSRSKEGQRSKDKGGMSSSSSRGRYERFERSKSRDGNSDKLNSRKNFIKPGDSDEDERTNVKVGRSRAKFMKPSGDDDTPSSMGSSKTQKIDNHVPSWKKKEFLKPVHNEENGSKHKDPADRHSGKRRRPSSSDSSSTSSNSSSSESDVESADEPETMKEVKSKVKILSEQEMNQLGAKIVKAEIMGNEEMASKLKAELEAARKLKEEYKDTPPEERNTEAEEGDTEVVLSRMSKDGMVRPLPNQQHPREHGKGRRKREKVDTHSKSGERQRYFADDDKFDLKTLVQREKMGTAEDQNSMFARLAGRSVEKTDDEYQLDDMFMSWANKKQSESRLEERDRALAIVEHRKMASAMEKCQFCFGTVPKHLIIAIGTKVYLSLPNHRSLTEGHCVVVPMQHVASSTAMDEDVWDEIQLFRKTLTKMFEDREEDVVFMETSMGLKHFPHMHLECVPMPRETGDLAPIYFKKAIQESETEWSQNKKVVDLSMKNIRKSVPKGFPFFSVDFGLQGGFAHVIENEQIFPRYFGKEIIGGMLDVEPRLWRKPQKENFDDQRKKVLQFSEWWKPYDWTQNLNKD